MARDQFDRRLWQDLTMHRPSPLIVGLALAASCCVSSLLGQTRLAAEEADKLVTKRPAAQYPAEASLARIQGLVLLDITVSETGSVIAAKLIYGHPLLVDAAVGAAKRRVYRPYLADGKPTAFVTVAGMSFFVDSQNDREQDRSRRYLTLRDNCLKATEGHKWTEAESVCSGALWIVGQMAGHDGIEKIDATDNVGFVYLHQQRFDKASEYFSRALVIAQHGPEKAQAELGYVCRNLGLAALGLGDLPKAREYYSNAEASLTLAQTKAGDEGLRAKCAKTLKSVLDLHLKAAREAGAAEEADEIQKRLTALR